MQYRWGGVPTSPLQSLAWGAQSATSAGPFWMPSVSPAYHPGMGSPTNPSPRMANSWYTKTCAVHREVALLDFVWEALAELAHVLDLPFSMYFSICSSNCHLFFRLDLMVSHLLLGLKKDLLVQEKHNVPIAYFSLRYTLNFPKLPGTDLK